MLGWIDSSAIALICGPISGPISGPMGGSLVLACTLIGFAIWLQSGEDRIREERRPRPDESEVDRVYFATRRRARKRTNYLIGICGLLIMATAWISHPIAWMTMWLLVMLCLLVVIGFAGKDAVRTYRYHQAKLKEVQRTM